jgi:hypothetical protein
VCHKGVCHEDGSASDNALIDGSRIEAVYSTSLREKLWVMISAVGAACISGVQTGYLAASAPLPSSRAIAELLGVFPTADSHCGSVLSGRFPVGSMKCDTTEAPLPLGRENRDMRNSSSPKNAL